MHYLLALLLLASTSVYADQRYLSDGNGGYYVYDNPPSNVGQQLSNFGNRGGLLSRMERSRQTQLQNQVNEQLLEQMRLQNELMRQQLGR